MPESLNITHLQTDEAYATFYCVRRMPNGKMGIARTALLIESMDIEDEREQKFVAQLIYGDLVHAMKRLKSTASN